MGIAQSKANELHEKKKAELQQLMKVLDSKREQFMAEVIMNRGNTVSEKEINGGRSVVRQSEIRVASQDSPNRQIKAAIGSFFEAAQGGNKGRQAMVTGATKLVSAGLDAIFGVSKGQGMEKRGFLVLFINFAFVRVDYFVYSYCVLGKKWASESSVSGCVQVTDMAVLDPATLNAMEIDYLIAQNLTLEKEAEGDRDAQFNVLMQIKVMLATNAVLNRIMKSPDTDFATLTTTMEQIRNIMLALANELQKLPAYEDGDEIMQKPLKDWKEAAKTNVKAKHMLKFIETDLKRGADWDNLAAMFPAKNAGTDEPPDVKKDRAMTIKKQYLAKFRKDFVNERDDEGNPKTYKDLTAHQKSAIFDLGYNEDEWDNWHPNYKLPGTVEWGPGDAAVPFNWDESKYYEPDELEPL
jgi:hypothetical protein